MASSRALLRESSASLNCLRLVARIEAADYTTGIRKTVSALTKLTVASQRAPLVTNLCVAYLAIEKYKLAKDACDHAVTLAPTNAIALNNRAVYHVLTGDVENSRANFKLAGAAKRLKNIVLHNTNTLNNSQLLAKQ